MKKFLFPVTTVLIIITMLFCSCVSVPSFEDLTTKAKEENEDSHTLPEPSKIDPSVNAEPSDTPSVSIPEETTVPPLETQYGTVIGYTAKGYAITVKNNMYYVDGVLIANKTYSLPADYNPGELLSECSAAFEQMKSDASAQGLSIWNASGFRSYSLQESLYTRYSNRDGKEAADRYSARPGHSEHQTGLAIDLNEISSSFANTAEGKWIAENCHKYGFILRYLQEKEAQTGYMYEPWHIRYVGTDVATKIYESGLCLEEYFGITSNYGDPLVPVGGSSVTVKPEENSTAPAHSEEITTDLVVG